MLKTSISRKLMKNGDLYAKKYASESCVYQKRTGQQVLSVYREKVSKISQQTASVIANVCK